tara:strand:- start:739 stop:1395 length:657 start_codon:yes stop_codon:yes gene_type:complete
MEQNNNIKWTNNLEAYLKEVGEHSLCLSMLHKSCEAKYSHKALCIDLPVIILSTICGSLTLSAKNLFGESYEDDALKIVGGLSLVTSTLGTIQAYFSFSRRAENHRNSYLEYAKLYRFIKVELGLPRESRIRPKDLLKLVNDNYERLNELSPLVDKKSISSFRGKYKRSTIERPPIVNGLEEIGIYKDEELEEQINLVINPTESATPSQNNNTEDLIV